LLSRFSYKRLSLIIALFDVYHRIAAAARDKRSGSHGGEADVM
jgi:hypothetical protein